MLTMPLKRIALQNLTLQSSFTWVFAMVSPRSFYSNQSTHLPGQPILVKIEILKPKF